MSFKKQLDDANKEQFFMSITDFCARKYYKRLSECKVKLKIYIVKKKKSDPLPTDKEMISL